MADQQQLQDLATSPQLQRSKSLYDLAKDAWLYGGYGDAMHQRASLGDKSQVGLGENSEYMKPMSSEDFLGASMPLEGLGGLAAPAKKALLNDIINQRNTVYHATTSYGLEDILKTGEIKPLNTSTSAATPGGVSVSRVPSIESMQKKPVILSLDASQIPKATPIAEPSWRKTVYNGDWAKHATLEEMTNYNKASLDEDYNKAADIVKGIHKRTGPAMASDFEFESRTKNQPIPISAIRDLIQRTGNSNAQESLLRRSLAGKPIAQLSGDNKAIALHRLLTTADQSRQLQPSMVPYASSLQDLIGGLLQK